MGKHFYTFDLNMVNHIQDEITETWSDKNESICEQKLSTDNMYKIFVKKYIEQFPSSICYDKRGKKWFEMFEQKQPQLSKEAKLEKLKREEEDRIYVEKMEKEEKKEKFVKQQNDLWESVKSGDKYGLCYFEDVDANIRNEKGETPLMVAVQNGHSSVIDCLHDAIVDVHIKDNDGRTAFDYIKKPTNRREKILSDRMYASLRMLEVAQIVRGKAKIVQMRYKNKTDILKIVISGNSCYMFVFPKNTQCQSR